MWTVVLFVVTSPVVCQQSSTLGFGTGPHSALAPHSATVFASWPFTLRHLITLWPSLLSTMPSDFDKVSLQDKPNLWELHGYLNLQSLEIFFHLGLPTVWLGVLSCDKKSRILYLPWKSTRPPFFIAWFPNHHDFTSWKLTYLYPLKLMVGRWNFLLKLSKGHVNFRGGNRALSSSKSFNHHFLNGGDDFQGLYNHQNLEGTAEVVFFHGRCFFASEICGEKNHVVDFKPDQLALPRDFWSAK